MSEKIILWIDDERFTLTNYKVLLEQKGYEVRSAYSLNAGKKLVEDNPAASLVIIDIGMALGDELELDESDAELAKSGYESGLVLSRWIRKHFPRLPLLVYSGTILNSTSYAWFEEQGIRFLPKATPFHSLNDFVAAIESSISSRRKQRESLKIFIVHGHDDRAKLELKNYLQNTLGLGEPVILHEQPSLGRTIIEKFEDEVRDVNLVFVLLTPDDVVYHSATPDNVKRRARQNVIFEMGYLLAKIGRWKGRVLLLYKGELDLPSDISGLIYININNGVDAAGEEIRRELRSIVKA